MGAKTLTIIYSALPHYRQPILELLGQLTEGRLEVYSGPDQFDPTLVTDVDISSGYHEVRNHYLMSRRVLWQSGVVLPGVRAENVILELNPRILNVWVTLVLRKILRRPTVLWGHAWSKRGSSPRFDRLRAAQRRLADAIVVYTQTQKRELLERTPGARVMSAPNSLYREGVSGPLATELAGHSFVFSGRLVPMKRPRLLLEAFAKARHSGAPGSSLSVIGDGPERPHLERLAVEFGISDAVRFYGHLTDPDRLRDIYADAVASVSPGPVGLAITQSLWFGVPMVVADDEQHGPEVEAAVEGRTAAFFRAGQVDELCDRLVQMWTDREIWRARRLTLAADCRATYSAEAMARRLLASADLANGVGTAVTVSASTVD